MTILQTLVFIILLCVVMYGLKRGIMRGEHDERQKLIRGKIN